MKVCREGWSLIKTETDLEVSFSSNPRLSLSYQLDTPDDAIYPTFSEADARLWKSFPYSLSISSTRMTRSTE
jgi:hypothetical protein